MKRSEINAALLRATKTLEHWRWALPEWGYWTAAEFAADPQARLDFFYRRHPSWDERRDLYPVYRADVPIT